MPESNSSRPTYYPDSAKSDLKGDKPAVHFAKSQYLTASDVDYSGDASFVIYYRQLSYGSEETIFSSHSYGTAEEGKTPFSVVVNDKKGLSFKMGDNLYDMNIIFDETPETNGDEYKGYMALYLTVNSSTKTVTVYNSRATEQVTLESPAATFTLDEAPYWESYSYGLSYIAKNKGFIGDMPESMIYNRVLSLDELNEINTYLKLKYEYPVLSKLALENEIYEIKKGLSVEPKIIGIGNLMGEESRITVTGAEIKSDNENVIIVLDGNLLKAVNFGSSKITVSYPGVPDYSFVVNVPQSVINEPVLTENNGVINIKEKIENYKEEQTLPIIMAAALYENDKLLDMKFRKATVGAEHTFDVDLTKPQDAENCKVYIMILDGETMVPVTDAIIK